MSDSENKTFSNIEEIRKIIEEGEVGMMSIEEAHSIMDEETKRLVDLDKERYLDPLHVQTPMLQKLQREFPNLNSKAGTANWSVLAMTANIIVELRTKGLSNPEIESIIAEAPMNLFKALYKNNLISKG